MGQKGHPVTFTQLEPSAYPFTLRAFRCSDDVEIWSTTVTGPGAVFIPGLRPKHGPVWMRTEYADGEVVETGRP
jgi:hypothetical protein